MNKRHLLAAAVTGVLWASGAEAKDNKSADKEKEADPMEKVHCLGINACKGKAECTWEPTGQGCAGANSCKGKGWITVTRKECNEKKGKIVN